MVGFPLHAQNQVTQLPEKQLQRQEYPDIAPKAANFLGRGTAITSTYLNTAGKGRQT